ncbi:MAG: hypothetical protein J2P19_24685 [Pseudonocardia sp.]|nr:hypothetical protein [Pseudonocardia sp.]
MIRPGPHSPNYWSELETWPRERIAERQLRALRRQLDYVYRNSAFYRRRWEDLGWRPAPRTRARAWCVSTSGLEPHGRRIRHRAGGRASGVVGAAVRR